MAPSEVLIWDERPLGLQEMWTVAQILLSSFALVIGLERASPGHSNWSLPGHHIGKRLIINESSYNRVRSTLDLRVPRA